MATNVWQNWQTDPFIQYADKFEYHTFELNDVQI